MQVQVLVLSADATFARMLEIEFEMQGIRTAVVASLEGDCDAEVVLLDLDSAMPPAAGTYRQMIGFTEREAVSGDGAGRLCSLVLRRPFEMRLLREEVRSLLFGETVRRTVPMPANTALSIHENGTVQLPDGRTVTLSPKECVVLRLLAKAQGKAVTRSELAKALGESSSNKADVYVCYLRKKIETPKQRLIRTVRGEGYCLMI